MKNTAKNNLFFCIKFNFYENQLIFASILILCFFSILIKSCYEFTRKKKVH